MPPSRRSSLGICRTLPLLLAVALVFGSGCSDLRGRRRIRVANQLYREGKFAEALSWFQAAEPLVPGFWLLWLNEGLTCRQMMVPGAHSADNQRAVGCALRAFDRVKRLRPDDPRGDQLYVQTLFDADRFAELAALYQQRLSARPNDRAAINALIQVYSRWNRPEEAIRWLERRAALDPQDPEAQYAVGVFIWNQLFQKGGGAEMAAFDPRPDPTAAETGGRARAAAAPANPPAKIAPPPALGDIVGTARIRLADLGIAYLTKALALRPHYRDAMVYLNLLYRQRSFAFFHDPAAWQTNIDAAEKWRRQAEQ
jgi:tetratricopeptide (TPR) repeat protein